MIAATAGYSYQTFAHVGILGLAIGAPQQSANGESGAPSP
jgi:hypothetical protein